MEFTGIFIGHVGGHSRRKYPAWRYHEAKEPRIVNNADEDMAAKAEGYEAVSAPLTANTGMVNWFWDLEDFSPRQLSVYDSE